MEAFLSIICSDRMRELKSKIDITDMTNEHQVTCLAEEYKDVLEALGRSVESPMFDNLREQCSHMLPTGGPRHQLSLAENTHQSPISEENTRPPTTLADKKNTRPLPPSLKELQKKKYAAVKAYSRHPTPENKDIMQALNRETKQKIAEFKRTGNNLIERQSSKQQITDNVDQHQMSRFADEDEDDTDSDDKDTDDEDTDNEDTDDEDINSDDIDNEDIGDEETDKEDINKENNGHDDIENKDFNSEYIDNCIINNENTDNNETDKEETNNEETKEEYRRHLGEEYKDVISWAEGLCARALTAYAYTAESTSQNPPVSSDKWDLRDDYMSARLKFYMSKMEVNFSPEERQKKARFSSEFMDWIRNLEKNLLLMLPSPTAGICQLQPATTNTSQVLPSNDNTSQSLPCKDTDYEVTANEDTVGEVMDNEDTDNKETTKDAYRRLSEEYKDIIDWAEELRERALHVTSASTSKSLIVSSDTETWTPRDAYMTARLEEYLSKVSLLPPAAIEDRRRHNCRTADDFIDWIFDFGKTIIRLCPSAAATFALLTDAGAGTSQSVPSNNKVNKDTDNEVTNDDETKEENSGQATQRLHHTPTAKTIQPQPPVKDNSQPSLLSTQIENVRPSSDPDPETVARIIVDNTKKEYRRRLDDEYKDVISWGKGLFEHALNSYPAGTSQPSTVSSQAENTQLSTNPYDSDMLPRFVEYMSKLEAGYSAEERKRNSRFVEENPDLKDWIYKNILRLSPSQVDDISHPQPSDENTNQPLPCKNTDGEDPNDEDTGSEDTEDDVHTDDVDTDEEDTFDEDTDDEEPAPPPTKTSAQFLSPVANARRPLVAAEIASGCLPSTVNRILSPRQAENANQILPSVASTSRSLTLNENTSLNSRQSQAPVRDTRPLPPALKELQRRKFAALKDYSRFPSPDNKRILKALEQEAKRGIAEFRRMEQQTAAIGERFDDFCSKLKVIDVDNRNETDRLAADYKDVLEFYFSQGEGPMLHLSNLLYQESLQRDTCYANTRRHPPPADPSVPPALQELLRRKRAALMIYRSYRSTENKIILRALEKEVKQGLAEFRRTGN